MPQVGLLEEMVLLLILKNRSTNGAEVTKNYIETFDRAITLPAIVTVLKRLEKKGFLCSEMSNPTSERGGKRKRMYSATSLGYEVANEIQSARNTLWRSIPDYDKLGQ